MDSTQRKSLVDALISYGLNEYEAKAYLALLQYGPAVAGDISRRSGIPRPRVYDTLQRLIDSSLVSESGGAPKSYAPLPLEEFLRNMSTEFRRRQELLRASLVNIQAEDCRAGVFHIHDEVPISRQVEDLISSAGSNIFISVHAADFSLVAPALEQAAGRGIPIIGNLFGSAESRPAWKLAERPTSENRTANGGRRLLISRDDEELLLAHIGGNERPYAIRTRNRLLIDELRTSVVATPTNGDGALIAKLVQA